MSQHAEDVAATGATLVASINENEVDVALLCVAKLDTLSASCSWTELEEAGIEGLLARALDAAGSEDVLREGLSKLFVSVASCHALELSTALEAAVDEGDAELAAFVIEELKKAVDQLPACQMVEELLGGTRIGKTLKSLGKAARKAGHAAIAAQLDVTVNEWKEKVASAMSEDVGPSSSSRSSLSKVERMREDRKRQDEEERRRDREVELERQRVIREANREQMEVKRQAEEVERENKEQKDAQRRADQAERQAEKAAAKSQLQAEKDAIFTCRGEGRWRSDGGCIGCRGSPRSLHCI